MAEILLNFMTRSTPEFFKEPLDSPVSEYLVSRSSLFGEAGDNLLSW